MTIRISHAPGIVASDYSEHQIPTPAPDGAQLVFTTPEPYVSGTLMVFRDQSSLMRGATHDWTETSPSAGTFTVASAPDADEVLWVTYVKA